MNSYWTQVDISLDGTSARLFMSDCAGKDQVVRAVRQGGWKAYEPPLPLLIARLCRALGSVFIDVGANTGYYSLLAAACGACEVWAFEPVPDIRAIMAANVTESGLRRRITLSEYALGEQEGQATLYLPDAGHGLIETSASLNPDFRKTHSGSVTVQVTTLDTVFAQAPWPEGTQVLAKIDVESLEAQVLRGGLQFTQRRRPTLVVELLPGADVAFVTQFMREHRYAHFWLNPANGLDNTGQEIELSLTRRDHLFVPQEQVLTLMNVLGGKSPPPVNHANGPASKPAQT